MAALFIILAAIVGLALLGRGVWWFCEVAFPSIILFLMKHF